MIPKSNIYQSISIVYSIYMDANETFTETTKTQPYSVRIRDIIGHFFLLIKQIDGNFVVELLTNEYKRQ